MQNATVLGYTTYSSFYSWLGSPEFEELRFHHSTMIANNSPDTFYMSKILSDATLLPIEQYASVARHLTRAGRHQRLPYVWHQEAQTPDCHSKEVHFKLRLSPDTTVTWPPQFLLSYPMRNDSRLNRAMNAINLIIRSFGLDQALFKPGWVKNPFRELMFRRRCQELLVPRVKTIPYSGDTSVNVFGFLSVAVIGGVLGAVVFAVELVVC